ncbi:hypothetical protein [Micromonospora sp. NPDC048839]
MPRRIRTDAARLLLPADLTLLGTTRTCAYPALRRNESGWRD